MDPSVRKEDSPPKRFRSGAPRGLDEEEEASSALGAGTSISIDPRKVRQCKQLMHLREMYEEARRALPPGNYAENLGSNVVYTVTTEPRSSSASERLAPMLTVTRTERTFPGISMVENKVKNDLDDEMKKLKMEIEACQERMGELSRKMTSDDDAEEELGHDYYKQAQQIKELREAITKLECGDKEALVTAIHRLRSVSFLAQDHAPHEAVAIKKFAARNLLLSTTTAAYLVGGENDSKSSTDVFHVLRKHKGWESLGNTRIARSGCAMTAVNGGGLAIVGGVNTLHNAMFQVELIVPDGFVRKVLPRLPVERAFCAAVCIENILYVLGGHDSDFNVLDLVHVCDLDKTPKSWEKAPSMDIRRRHFTACVLDGQILALGGIDEDKKTLASVSACNLETGEWEQMPRMKTARASAASAVLGGRLYVMGGSIDSRLQEATSSVEMYDPVGDKWVYKAPMNIARLGCAAVVLKGHLYVMGGLGAENNCLRSVERYDEGLDRWFLDEEKQLPGPLCFFAAAAL